MLNSSCTFPLHLSMCVVNNPTQHINGSLEVHLLDSIAPVATCLKRLSSLSSVASIAVGGA